jgi:hypothetical protein
MRDREQRQYDHDRQTYRLTFPDGVKFDQVTQWLDAIRKNLGPTRFGMVASTIVAEMIHREHGIEHRIRVPAGIKGEQIYNQLEGHIPGVHIELLEEPAYPAWTFAQELGTTAHQARLDIRQAAAMSRTLLNSGQNLGKHEATVVQLVIMAAAREKVRPEPTQTIRLKRLPIDLPTRGRTDAKEHRAKQEEPNFLAIVRVAASAPSHGRARELVTALSRAIGSADGNARFRKLLRPGDAVERVNRAAVPFQFPAQLMLSEVGALAAYRLDSMDVPGLRKPPTQHMRADPAIPTHGIKIGHSTAKPDRSVAIESDSLMTHLLLLGKTNTGKSTVFEHLAYQWIREPWHGRKKGLLLLDPHGDLTANFLNAISADRIDDVVYVNPLDIDMPVGMNLLGGPRPSLTTSYMMGVLEKLYGTGPLTGHVLRNTIYTVALRGGMTLYEVALALDDPEFRDELTRDVKDEQLKRYWTRYENLSRAEQSQSTEPVMRRLGAFLTPELRGIFGQTGGLDMRRALAEGKIVVINLSQGKLGEQSAELLGAMSVALLWQAVQERANIPEGQRTPFLLLADEFHRFMKLPTSFGDILAEARKYRLGCCMATQSIGQITEVRNDVMVNARTKILFELGSSDAGMVGREIGVDPNDISRLPQHTAILNVPHAPSATVKTLPPPEPVGRAADVIAASRSNYGKPAEDIELEMAARRKPRPQHRRMRPKVGRED